MIQFFILIWNLSYTLPIYSVPDDFVNLGELDSTFAFDLRYNTYHNFVGRKINGYVYGNCYLKRDAAQQLIENQRLAVSLGYRLKLWDCYRPQKAVDDFYEWSQNNDTLMQQEFYINEPKSTLFDRGFIAKKSGHSRGSTVDITLIKDDYQESYYPGMPLKPCFNKDRFKDSSIDMGTGFDCFDPMAYTKSTAITQQQKQNRELLLYIMKNFVNFEQEWWHFTYRFEDKTIQPYDFDT